MADQQLEMIEYTTQDMICFLIEDYKLDLKEAMDVFYMSKTFEKLTDIETGLYLEESSYIYEMWKSETDMPVKRRA